MIDHAIIDEPSQTQKMLLEKFLKKKGIIISDSTKKKKIVDKLRG